MLNDGSSNANEAGSVPTHGLTLGEKRRFVRPRVRDLGGKSDLFTLIAIQDNGTVRVEWRDLGGCSETWTLSIEDWKAYPLDGAPPDPREQVAELTRRLAIAEETIRVMRAAAEAYLPWQPR
jgi:hypothetical protein